LNLGCVVPDDMNLYYATFREAYAEDPRRVESSGVS
jgi:hypothetical protein